MRGHVTSLDLRRAALTRSGAGRPSPADVHYSRTTMRATLSYTLLRLLLFFAAVLVLALFGVHGITLVVVALVVSSIISLPLLSRLRDRMSTSITGKIDGFHARLDEGSKAEDGD